MTRQHKVSIKTVSMHRGVEPDMLVCCLEHFISFQPVDELIFSLVNGIIVQLIHRKVKSTDSFTAKLLV